MMTREEEKARLIEDRDAAEKEVYQLEERICEIVREFPNSFEEHPEYSSLIEELSAYENEVMYLMSCLEDFNE